MANRVTIESNSPITVTQGTPAIKILSPDGKSEYDSTVYDADVAEIARVSGLLGADPACVQRITPEAWTPLLVAEDARWRTAYAKDPTAQPSWPLGPYGVHYLPGAVHDNGPSSPFSGGVWEMASPATELENWFSAPPSLKLTIPAYVPPYLAQLKLQTKPGWALGWGPVAV
jgi:hypothetical protein